MRQECRVPNHSTHVNIQQLDAYVLHVYTNVYEHMITYVCMFKGIAFSYLLIINAPDPPACNFHDIDHFKYMYVCMYMCVHICIYIYMCVCMNVCIYI